MKQAGLIFITALLTAILAIAGYRHVEKRQYRFFTSGDGSPAGGGKTNQPSASVAFDFTKAASLSTPAVVHIKTMYEPSGSGAQNPYEFFYGIPQGQIPATGSGSGVLVTADGYIVTNNHVVEGANQVEVILPDKRYFKAKVVGRDSNTDLALLKINEKKLPYIALGNSDQVQVGEWVLAVGYPLSLNSTVTAGIVSAKGRSIGLLDRPSQDIFGDEEELESTGTAIESFIQTDAAINPGNSGGALVNADGRLIGINSAMASQSGTYVGYGFAIPVNLVRKIVSDFRKYGEVKRGYLGVSFPAPVVEEQLLREKGINPGSVKGVYITDVQPGSAAASAGLKSGDIIQSINGIKISSSAEFSERIARQRPGDKLKLGYLRDKKPATVTVTLKGESEADKKREMLAGIHAKLGAKFAPIPDEIKQQFRLKAGLIITKVEDGGFCDLAGIPEGTVITSVNGRPISTIAQLDAALSASRSGVVRLEGIIPNGTSFVFTFPLGA